MKTRLAIVCAALSTVVNTEAVTRYVNSNNPNPNPPFTNWGMAATTIQDAVDASVAGDEIVVTNGVYDTGARQVYGMSNRVAVTKPLILRSVNGPDVTIIQGYQVPGTVNGETAVRCVYLTNNAMLVGFTLTKGATKTSGDTFTDVTGGGVWSERAQGGQGLAVISNCVLTGNYSHNGGGGAYSGSFYNSVLTGNYSYNGGAAWGSTLIGCIIRNNWAAAGGGGGGCTMTNCIIEFNSATYYGGGHSGGLLKNCLLRGNYGKFGGGDSRSTLINCVLVQNTSNQYGGGAHRSTLINCVVAANHAFVAGGGAYSSVINNSIAYYNTTGTNIDNHYNSTLSYSCTTPLPEGAGNFTNAPLFVDAVHWENFRLQPDSPCINAGNNTYVATTTDLDHNPRIVGGTVDVGAYEFQTPASILSYAWLQQHGFPTDGSVDFTDVDGEGMNNYWEWRADTNPTNALSLLRIINATNGVGGGIVTWQSVATRRYMLERSTNLAAASPFQIIATNIAGAIDTVTFTDASATNNGPYFYRVGIQ